MSTAVMSRTVRKRWWWLLWGSLTVLALAVAGYFVPPYLSGGTTIPNIDRITPGYYTSLVIHAVPAGIALITGPWQFVPRLRARFPRSHRVMGRVYLIAVVAAALAAVYSSAVTKSGFPLQVAFFVLIVAWLYTAAKAYRAIRRRDVALHRIWTIRNYTLTFAAVPLRLYQLPLLALMNSVTWLEYKDVYTVSAWMSLLGSILVAEYFIIQRIRAPRSRHATVTEAPEPGYATK
ncbi:putative membrane protein [Kibdelosporangium banguiense]|uniref:Membrane protein n=1 Tax=Kibdelosporangium banguiense TaxID=1365924 RepID=A0ABS4TK57_9PSEU|nr:DUF2306 domain-containing protein [Kibdelosporangium banguiense]MBP2324807.1 putative membrane protein [Kibdelosporangium banguiense]